MMRGVKLITALASATILAAFACESPEPSADSAGESESGGASADDEPIAGVVAQPLYPSEAFVDLVLGSTSGITEEHTEVVRTPEAWARLWRSHNSHILPTPALPEVDFEKRMVLAIILGQRNSGGWSIEIVDVAFQGTTLAADAVVRSPEPGQPTTLAMTSPFHFVTVETTTNTVGFRIRPE